MNSQPHQIDASPMNRHALSQPLNIIRLAAGNIRVRILPQLTESDAEYLTKKLERIERQVDRTVAMIERLCNPAIDTSQQEL